MFILNRLREVESEILEIRKKGVEDGENIGKSADVRKNVRELKIGVLESERSFILDRRNGWKAKTLWNVLVPIIVTVATTIALNFLL